MADANIIKGDFEGLAKRKSKKNRAIDSEPLICSFCGRNSSEVLKMVKGPNVNICSECVMVAVQYLVMKDSMPSEEAQKILDMFWGIGK